MKPPRLIVGLGNPGFEYQTTRHNAGFWFCDYLAQLLKTSFHIESRFNGEVAKCDAFFLLKPNTFMNHSGQSVGALARFYKIPAEQILIVHDELDIPPGQLRLKFGGSNGGHNGLKSIQAHCATPDFWRLRIGIGHPGNRSQVIHYVLKSPAKQEQLLIDQAIDRALISWPLIREAQWTTAMTQLNSRKLDTL